jgi:hypothetical protein
MAQYPEKDFEFGAPAPLPNAHDNLASPSPLGNPGHFNDHLPLGGGGISDMHLDGNAGLGNDNLNY